MREIPAALVEAVVDPPRGCADLPDVGGRIRARPEDFEVEELPAYEADGRPGHLLVWLTKRSLSTREAVLEIARQLRVAHADVGVAGLKDRDAVTRQQISVPERARDAIARFSHPAITLEDPRPHSHKLRRGHLRGNRFCVVVRGLEPSLAEAERRAAAKLARVAAEGLRNYYGAQRFGKDARNLAPGLARLGAGGGRPRRPKKGDIVVSAGQSALLNLYLATRTERGLLRTALAGDILQKTTGGMFECEDPSVDQARLDAGELVVTGPMYGSKMRAPGPDTPAAALEREILELAAIAPASLAALGRAVPGTRRQLWVFPEQVRLAPAVDELGLGEGLELHFCLPPGSYATILLRELCG